MDLDDGPVERQIQEARKHGAGGLRSAKLLAASPNGALWVNMGDYVQRVGQRGRDVPAALPQRRRGTIAGRLEAHTAPQLRAIGKMLWRRMSLLCEKGSRTTRVQAGRPAFS